MVKPLAAFVDESVELVLSLFAGARDPSVSDIIDRNFRLDVGLISEAQ
jgi:hypothetical protein